MQALNIEEQSRVSKEFSTESHVVGNIYAQELNGVPCGYMTSDEWLARSKKNISEIFRKHEQGLL